MKHAFVIAAILVSTLICKGQHLSVINSIIERPAASFKAEVHADGEHAFILRVQNPENISLKVEIRHVSLGTLTETTVSQSNYHCRYNLQDLEDGVYEIFISNGREKFSRKIELNSVVRVQRKLVLK